MASGKITRIKPRKTRRAACEIELDEKPWLSVGIEIMARFGLAQGLHLSEADAEKVEKAERNADLKFRLGTYLSRGIRSRRQAENWLRRQRSDEEERQSLLTWAEQQGLLNDTRFAGAFVRTRRRTQYVGPRRLAQQLRAAGVPEETVNRTLEEHRGIDFRGVITHDEADLQPDEEIQKAECLKLLQRAGRRFVREEDTRKRDQKALRYLVNRGYEFDPARAAWQHYLAAQNDN